jgi:hypothetical protein
MSRRPLASWIVVAVLVAGCVGGGQEPLATVPTPSPDSAPETPEGLHVGGIELRTAAGERLVMVGASAYLLPFYTSAEDPSRPAPLLAEVTDRAFANRRQMFDQMRRAGVNTVRIPLGSVVFETDPYSLGGTARHLDRIEAVVDDATEAGLYVVLGWWDALQLEGEFADRFDQPFDMMRQVVGRLGERPMVMYEPHNEPNGVSWDEWQEAMETTVRFWRAELGYQGVLVIGTPEWSHVFDAGRAETLMELDAGINGLGSPNLLFTHHRYSRGREDFAADRADFEENAGRWVGEYPIIVTETGAYSEGKGEAYAPEWFRGFLDHLVSESVPAGLNGVIVWNWNWGRPLDRGGSSVLTLDGVGRLNATGQIVDSTLLTPLAVP